MGYIIGISAYYHDSSACLFKDDELLFACEEEKFTGIKHDSSFPVKTIEYIFKKYNLTKEDIEAVCYYENLNNKINRVFKNSKKQFFKHPLYSFKSFYSALKNKKEAKKNLKKISSNIFYSNHHDSHAYYSFYTSDFSAATVLSIDGVGEFETIQASILVKNKLEHIPISEYPHSLGLFYSAMTAFLGFKPNEGEYKVMGLAAYGNPKRYRDKIDKLIKYKNGSLECNLECFVWDRSDTIMFNHKLSEIIGQENRLPDEKIKSYHMDIAASVQEKYEDILSRILTDIHITTFEKHDNLCLGGGCAYNGTANGKITRFSRFKNLWVPPAPSDAGSAIGSCLNYLEKNGKLKNRVKKTPFLGPEFKQTDYLKAMEKNNLTYSSYGWYDLIKVVAKYISEGKVIGWFQGRIEFGARALGNRSILADPTKEGMQAKINKVIKKRESFRPFAPMVIKEKQTKFFYYDADVPYMNQVVRINNNYIGKLPAITHVDGTARIQTVTEENKIYELLLEFEKISGYPILLNTSFNVKDKTMVLTPEDAIDTFLDTEMDILVLGNNVIKKERK